MMVVRDAGRMAGVADGSIALVVTSPPYPMIEMWDQTFVGQDQNIAELMRQEKRMATFEAMHGVLDRVWREVERVLTPGGIACINIGDATRTIGGDFKLYPNHSRVLSCMVALGFTPLPAILWRKQTNAPNKFMGSGMYPPGAYVTLEHEYVLVLRKGSKRLFERPSEKDNRRCSAYFWEERNQWFSDVWFDLKGTRQNWNNPRSRKRSGAFPFELAYRLINMFSVRNDTVLDPFLGTGTTAAAAMAAGRNSVGYEVEPAFRDDWQSLADTIVPFANARIEARLRDHLAFVEDRFRQKGAFKHRNRHYGFPVVTRQEKDLLLNALQEVRKGKGNSQVGRYVEGPQPEFCGDWQDYLGARREKGDTTTPKPAVKRGRPPVQLQFDSATRLR
jgi:DNA modification methylase